MLTPRLIPIVTLIGDSAVKTKAFQNPNYVGDPVNTISLLSSFEAEELVVLDISKNFGSEESPEKTLAGIVSNAFMPIAFGGNIRSANDAKRKFEIGFDKIIVRSSLKDFRITNEIADTYGQQAISGCLDFELMEDGKHEAVINGTVYGEENFSSLTKLILASGVGEIILQDISHDGTRAGLRSTWVLNRLLKEVDLPVIPLGGCSSVQDAGRFIRDNKCHSVAASSVFLYRPTRDAVLINYPSMQEWHHAIEHN